MIHRQVAALVGHLSGHHHDLVPLHGGAENVIQVAVFRQSAHAEALDDESVIVLRHELHQLRFRPRDQLQQPHIVVQFVIEGGFSRHRA